MELEMRAREFLFGDSNIVKKIIGTPHTIYDWGSRRLKGTPLRYIVWGNDLRKSLGAAPCDSFFLGYDDTSCDLSFWNMDFCKTL